MSSRVSLSYFQKLFLYFFIAGILLALLMALLIVQYSSAQAQIGVSEQTRSGVQSVAANLDGLLSRCADGILGLSRDTQISSYLRETNGVTRYDIAHTVYLTSNAVKPGVSVLVKRLSDGEIVSAGEASSAFENEHYNPAYTMFRRFFDADNVGIYTTVRGINMQKSTRIVLGRFVRDARGIAIGLVAMEIGREALMNVVSGYAFVSNKPILLVDHFDTVLLNSRYEDEEGLNKLGFRGDLSQLWGSSGMSGIIGEDNVAWHRAAFANYAVLGEVSQDFVAAVRSSGKRAFLPVFALVFVLSALFSYLAARRVSAPVKRLTLAMQEVEKGKLTEKVPVNSNDEIGQLTAAFNRMQFEIHELIERNKEKQRNLRIAEVNALSLQINPHFLYNVLDLIKWSIKLQRHEQSVQMIVQLGHLLRMLMNNTEDTITVSGEIQIVQAYLEIQRVRWQDRLEVQFDIAPGIEHLVIPKLMLQPLIENAIQHGLEDMPERGLVHISGRREGNYLHFRVLDSGRGMSAQKLEQVRKTTPDGMYHIGLSNLDQRAKLFGDESCGLEINSAEGRGTTILLTVKVGNGDGRTHV